MQAAAAVLAKPKQRCGAHLSPKGKGMRPALPTGEARGAAAACYGGAIAPTTKMWGTQNLCNGRAALAPT